MDTSTSCNLPEPPKKQQPVLACRWTASPVIIPGLYDGNNKTFFTGAYEGLRSNRHDQPDFAGAMPTEKMRRGDFSARSPPDRQPDARCPTPATRSRGGHRRRRRCDCCRYYPMPNLPVWPAPPGADVLTENTVRPDAVRVDQNIGSSARMYGRYNWVDAFDGFGDTARPTGLLPARDEQEHVAVVAADALTDAAQRLPHRADHPDRLGHAEQPHIDGTARRARPRQPRFRRGRASYDNPASPPSSDHRITPGLGAAGTNWYQFDTTFHVVERAVVEQGDVQHAQPAIDLRKMRTGRRRRQHPRGRFDFTSAMTGHAVADFIYRVPAHRPDAGRPAAGRRRPVANGLLRQRRVAGDAVT